MKHGSLEKFRAIFSGLPELILVIEYPRPKHVQRIGAKGIHVRPFDELLREFVGLLQEELAHSGGKEGKENNYATRLIKALLSKGILKTER